MIFSGEIYYQKVRTFTNLKLDRNNV